MPKLKDRPEKHNGGGGGDYNAQQGVIDPSTGVPPNTPQTVVGSPVGGPGARSDVPTMRPPGFSAAPGRYMQSGSWQAPGFPPPPADAAPVGIEGLAVPLPLGTKATHFSGPLVSGGVPQAPLWRAPGSAPPAGSAPVAGSALLSAPFSFDYSMGDFTVPLQFPDDCLIVGYASATLVAFAAPPTFELGTTSGAGDIVASGALPALGAPMAFAAAAGQLPLWDAVPPLHPFQAFLTVAGNTGGTAGLGLIWIQYVRIPQRWT